VRLIVLSPRWCCGVGGRNRFASLLLGLVFRRRKCTKLYVAKHRWEFKKAKRADLAFPGYLHLSETNLNRYDRDRVNVQNPDQEHVASMTTATTSSCSAGWLMIVAVAWAKKRPLLLQSINRSFVSISFCALHT